MFPSHRPMIHDRFYLCCIHFIVLPAFIPLFFDPHFQNSWLMQLKNLFHCGSKENGTCNNLDLSIVADIQYIE